MQPDEFAPADLYSQFADSLFDPLRPLRLAVRRSPGYGAEARYNVYRNNVTVSLVDALADIFPACVRIVGAPFFRTIARLYVRASPPSSPLLCDYGKDFPAFIAKFHRTSSMPWLSDVARIERGWLDACHAEDAPPLSPNELELLTADDLWRARLVPHPAMRIVRSVYPALTIFMANRADDPVGKIMVRSGEDTLITRPYLDVRVHRLTAGAASFLAALSAGESLGGAAEIALAAHDGFNLSDQIAVMLEAGAFRAIEVPE